MARSKFGGTHLDVVISPWRFSQQRTVAQLRAGVEVTFWDAATGGNKITDLLLDGSPTATITADDSGYLPQFEGPDGVLTMWADAGFGRRFLTVTTDGAIDLSTQLSTRIPTSEKGAIDGVATLGATGKVEQPVPWGNVEGAPPFVVADQLDAINVTDPTYGAVGDGVTDDTAAIMAAIDAAGTPGRTVYLPAGDYLVSSTILIEKNGVHLRGDGPGFDMNGIADLRATATTRILFDAAAAPAPVVKVTSVGGTVPKVGGGVSNLMLDGNNRATRCLDVTTRRGGVFEDLLLYGATDEMLFTGSFGDTLSATPYDVQFCRFVRVTTSARNLTTNTAHAARLTGGQGAGGTANGNTSFNQFIGCQFHTYSADALVLEDTDNNYFFGCSGGPDTGTNYGLVLSSSDQDTGGMGGHARFNAFFGCEFSGIYAHASQTGAASSADNQFYGLNYSNAAAAVIFQAPAGGSAKATVRMYSSTGAERLNATQAAIGSVSTQLGPMRQAFGSESVRVRNAASNHVLLESGDGSSAWGLSIEEATGNLRTTRAAGTGRIDINGDLRFVNRVGFYGVTPVARAASPGVATGVDAAVINAIITALRNLGLVT